MAVYSIFQRLLRLFFRRNTAGSLLVCFMVSSTWFTPGYAGTDDAGAHAQQLKQNRIDLLNAVRQDPTDADARLRLATISLSLGELESAQKEFEKALQLGAPSHQVIPPLAKTHLRLGEYKKALSLLDSATSGPNSYLAAILALRAKANEGLGDVGAAKPLFTQALEKDPRQVDALLGLATLEISEGKTLSAYEYLRTAASVAPDNAEVWGTLGDVALSSSKPNDAFEYYQKANKINRSGVSLLGLARSSLAMGQLQEALNYVAQLKKRVPQQPVVGHLNGMIAYRRGDFKAAKNAFESALSSDFDYAHSLPFLASTLYHLGQYEQSLAYANRAMASNQNGLANDILRLKSLTLLRLGQPKATLSAIERVFPDSFSDPALLAIAASAAVEAEDDLKVSELINLGIHLPQQGAAAIFRQVRRDIGVNNKPQALADLAPLITADLVDRPTRTMMASVSGLLQEKRFSDALVYTRMLVNGWPMRADVYVIHALALSGSGQLDEATKAIAKATKLSPRDPAILFNAANIRRIAGELPDYESVLAVNPYYLPALEALATSAKENGNAAKAIEWLEKANQAAPQDARVAMRLATAYWQAKEFDKGVKVMEQAARIQPDNANVRETLGFIQMAAGADQSGTENLRKAIELNPEAARAHYHLAMALAKGGDKAPAKRELKRALEITPDYYKAGYLLAKLQGADKGIDAALDVAKQMQAQRPRSASGYKLEAEIRRGEGENRKAFLAYNKALDLQPDSDLAIKTFITGTQSGDAKIARMGLREWVRVHPMDSTARTYLAVAYRDAGDYSLASEEFSSLLERDDKNVLALNELALISLQQGDRNSALDYARRAYKSAGNDPEIADTLGWVYFETGDKRRALDLLRQAATDAPDNLEIRYHYAVALYDSGKIPDARAQLEALLGENKPFLNKIEAMSLLGKVKGLGTTGH